jgi:hypothetical protein
LPVAMSRSTAWPVAGNVRQATAGGSRASTASPRPSLGCPSWPTNCQITSHPGEVDDDKSPTPKHKSPAYVALAATDWPSGTRRLWNTTPLSEVGSSEQGSDVGIARESQQSQQPIRHKGIKHHVERAFCLQLVPQIVHSPSPIVQCCTDPHWRHFQPPDTIAIDGTSITSGSSDALV